MKLMGGDWSRGDLLALLGVIVAIVGVIVAILTIPGMPKLFHWDSDSSVEPSGPAPGPHKTEPVAPTRIRKTRDVTSGQVNFGCDQSLPVETPVISFGKNPRDIDSRVVWADTDNVKTQNQSVVNIESPTDHDLAGVKGVGSITGRDSQNILGVRNCPGGGHGELTLHVVWSEDE
jgi:hypothetical protein